MDFIKAIEEYSPVNQQETQDKKVIQQYICSFPDNVLLRSNEIAHITSSGFIMNPTLDKVLMVHHNIRNTWAWTGGHADGDGDLLHVAIKEAKEETGVIHIAPLFSGIASIDVLAMGGHCKKGKYVNTHLHLSVGYILVCDEKELLHICEEENSDVQWISTDKFTNELFSDSDVYLYQKLISCGKRYVDGGSR